jgi:hypothetical protein
MPNMIDYVVDALRGKPKNDKLKTTDVKQARGYRLYVDEAKLNGETPMPYNDWIKQAPALDAPQQ